MRNRAQLPSPVNPADDTRPETDSERSQRFLNDIDRATWQGNHPPSSKGPRGIVHKIGWPSMSRTSTSPSKVSAPQ